MTQPQTLTLTRPDDWHLHVRDGHALHTVVPHTAAQFGRAVIVRAQRVQQVHAYGNGQPALEWLDKYFHTPSSNADHHQSIQWR